MDALGGCCSSDISPSLQRHANPITTSNLEGKKKQQESTKMNGRLWLAKILTISEGGKKTRRQKNTTHTTSNCSHLVYMWWMRPRETYSTEYHTTHDFDLPINYTVFSRKKKSEDIHNKTHTQQIFFIPLLDAISSKKNYSSQFHVKNAPLWAANYQKPTKDAEKKKEVQTHVWSTKTYKLQLEHWCNHVLHWIVLFFCFLSLPCWSPPPQDT